jgi:drug/metabolite transporter (DMT)-like permease
MPPRAPGRIIGTSEGLSADQFAAFDWFLLVVIAAFWGSTFLFIDIGLDHFTPGLIVILRLAFGVAALALVPAARKPIDRQDWPQLLVMAAIWLALPIALMPLAQQRIDSSFAGMLSGAVPLIAALVAALLLRRRPGRIQLIGLIIGFAGILAITIPTTGGESASVLGTILMLLVVLCFGVGTNLAVPLTQRYGALPAMLNAQAISLIMVLPYAATDVADSSFAVDSFLAILALGLTSSGGALIAMSTLASRVGAPRANVAVYFVPIVAIVLGVLIRDDTVKAIAIGGIALVLIGAFLTSRADTRPPKPSTDPVPPTSKPAHAP